MSEKSPKAIVLDLLTTLENIARDHREVTDTDVRDAIYLTIQRFFIWGNPVDRFPTTFLLMSAAADVLVATAVERFVRDILKTDAARLPLGRARFDLVQDYSIETPGGRKFDDFLGTGPEPLPDKPLPGYLFEPRDSGG